MMLVSPSDYPRWSDSFSSRWKNPLAWLQTADVFACLTAAALPWSTSLMAIFATMWLVTLVPAIRPREFFDLLKTPALYLPVLLFVLAVVGVSWSEAGMHAAFRGINPMAKLLMIPFIVYHFSRSPYGHRVFIAFLVSCALLMLLSWAIAFDAHLAKIVQIENTYYGVPVKNYIAQSQEFALCAVGLCGLILSLIRRRKMMFALMLAGLSALFILNMVAITVSRTALVTLPVMFGLFALINLKWRGIAAACAAMLAVLAMAWMVSPNVQVKLATIGGEYQRYQTSTDVTSGGLRLEFWRKSIMFFKDAPIIGHGTGSILGLFERAAVNQTGVAAEVIGNPHNQILHSAVQWGVVGVGLLLLMWAAHLLLFWRAAPARVQAAWIGLLVVVQNIASSVFNSHIVDYHEGWIYVLGVGVAGGIIMQKRGALAARGEP